jgi:hypothetical protein
MPRVGCVLIELLTDVPLFQRKRDENLKFNEIISL